MSKRGVFQLSRLVINYCRNGGSSAGTREFLETKLPAFAAAHPHVVAETNVKGGKHPHATAHYLNGAVKTFPLRNLDTDGVEKALQTLHSQTGRSAKFRPRGGQGVGQGPGAEARGRSSIQGYGHPLHVLETENAYNPERPPIDGLHKE